MVKRSLRRYASSSIISRLQRSLNFSEEETFYICSPLAVFLQVAVLSRGPGTSGRVGGAAELHLFFQPSAAASKTTFVSLFTIVGCSAV